MSKTYCVCVLCLALQAVHLPAAAQLYKWTDAQGKVHYTDRAGDASAGRASEIKVAPAPDEEEQSKLRQKWREQEAAYQQRHTAPAPRPLLRLPVAKDRGYPVNYRSEAPAAKCGLARDILSGEAVHTNRKPVDQNDRNIAANDVKLFCR